MQIEDKLYGTCSTYMASSNRAHQFLIKTKIAYIRLSAAHGRLFI